MKKLIYYAGIMTAIVILLPMFIVRSCGPAPVPEPKDEPVPVKTCEITVYNHMTGETERVDLEEYLKCVLAAEMPADFDMEALKAQAVAARTFAYGRISGTYRSKQGVHDGIDVCTDSTHCQAWMSRESAMKRWKILFASRNWGKISKAVNDTKGIIAVYNGTVANTLFHASSPGRTENAEDVWQGKSVPYLKSVESSGDEASKGYTTSVAVSTGELAEKLIRAYPHAELGDDLTKKIKIIDFTAGGRVKTLRISNITMRGTEFRSMLGLRSACFSIEFVDDDLMRITTTGHGHGVGMSQWGANALAKTGGTYREILRHYYTGIDLVAISDYEAVARLD
jgi:stage II sporulation protein D